METDTQKSALSDSLKAEEKKVMSKESVLPKKNTLSKPRTSKLKATAKPAKRAVKSNPKKRAIGTASPSKSEKKHTKSKVVRDSFTMPENEYNVLAVLKKQCLASGLDVKKSQLLRAGLKSLSEMSQASLKKQLSKLDEIKIGRPLKTAKRK
jgi:hypothetical protein